MPVVNTLPLLNKILAMYEGKVGEQLIELQRKVLCNPLQKYFPDALLEEVHFELLAQGLFNPFECREIEATVEKLEAKKIWFTLEKEFERLKRLWEGIDVPVYVYPLTKECPPMDGVEMNKNGVAYRNVIFLFVSPDLDELELKALLAHEYHHVCRLSILNTPHEEIELLDSLLIEGMAESAVEELYGEKGLSPWTKWYADEEGMRAWKKYFAKQLDVKGVNHHQFFLFGDEAAGLPKWIGYCLGYQIVQSFMQERGPVPQQRLYKISSEEILRHTVFRL